MGVAVSLQSSLPTAMGKKRKHLSHEEIWDDSALLNSWDAALQEYQVLSTVFTLQLPANIF